MKDPVTVAIAYKLEIDPKTNDTFMVFKILDEQFKNIIRENWTSVDIPLVFIDDLKTKLSIAQRRIK